MTYKIVTLDLTVTVAEVSQPPVRSSEPRRRTAEILLAEGRVASSPTLSLAGNDCQVPERNTWRARVLRRLLPATRVPRATEYPLLLKNMLRANSRITDRPILGVTSSLRLHLPQVPFLRRAARAFLEKLWLQVLRLGRCHPQHHPRCHLHAPPLARTIPKETERTRLVEPRKIASVGVGRQPMTASPTKLARARRTPPTLRPRRNGGIT